MAARSLFEIAILRKIKIESFWGWTHEQCSCRAAHHASAYPEQNKGYCCPIEIESDHAGCGQVRAGGPSIKPWRFLMRFQNKTIGSFLGHPAVGGDGVYRMQHHPAGGAGWRGGAAPWSAALSVTSPATPARAGGHWRRARAGWAARWWASNWTGAFARAAASASPATSRSVRTMGPSCARSKSNGRGWGAN